MRFATTNPTTNQVLEKYPFHIWEKVKGLLRKSAFGFENNRKSNFNQRSRRLHTVADLLESKKKHLAHLMTLEMGKPISQAEAEIEKCAWVCRYYADNARIFLKDEHIKTEHKSSIVTHAPLGVILAIMPWNFPFWQVFRFVAPALMAGNAILLKHASNVPQCALAIEALFQEAGFPMGIFQNVFINHNKVAWLIAHERIQAVTLTGSDAAGAKVAQLAGKHIKKMVLELGGSDPFIVLDDANVKEAAQQAVASRMLNNGQSCIAAKRFIVLEKVAPDFINEMTKHIGSLKMGDPMDENTDVGPLAREDLAVKLSKQVAASVKKGAKVILGGQRPKNLKGAFYEPTLLTNVKEGMPVFDEEVFGPVAPIIVAKNVTEAVYLANQTPYGLGASIWTTDPERGSRLARQIDSGCVFINAMVASDPRLPFGGIKKSGYGRELSEQGIKEFVNVKTVVVG